MGRRKRVSDCDRELVLADESAKTRKARDKLEKKFDEMQKKINAKALEKKSIEIHRWISRHANHRIVLKTKAISLFDENQNTADISRKITKIVHSMNLN